MSRYDALRTDEDERQELTDARRLIGRTRDGFINVHTLPIALERIFALGWPRGQPGEGRLTSAEAAAYIHAIVHPDQAAPGLNQNYLATFRRGIERLGLNPGMFLSDIQHGVQRELTSLLEQMEARAAAGEPVRELTEQYLAAARIRDATGMAAPDDTENRFQTAQRLGFTNEINTLTTEAERLMALQSPTTADRTRMAELFGELNEWRTVNPQAFNNGRITGAQFNALAQVAGSHHLEQLRAEHGQNRPGGDAWRGLQQAVDALGGPRTFGLSDLNYDVLGRREQRLQQEDLRRRLEQLERQPPDPGGEVQVVSADRPEHRPQQVASLAPAPAA